MDKDKLIVASLLALKMSQLGLRDKHAGRIAFETFMSPQPSREAVVFPEEARRWSK